MKTQDEDLISRMSRSPAGGIDIDKLTAEVCSKTMRLFKLRAELEEKTGVEIYLKSPESFPGYEAASWRFIRASSTDSFASQVRKFKPDIVAGLVIENNGVYENKCGYALKQDS